VLDNRLKNGLLLIAPVSTQYSWFTSLNGLKLKNYEQKKAWVLTDQIQLIDRRRLINKKLDGQGKRIKYGSNFVKKVIEIYKTLFPL